MLHKSFFSKVAMATVFFLLSASLLSAQDNRNNPRNGNGRKMPMGPQMMDAQQIQWYTNFSQASNAAKDQNKPMLLFFTGSDWCGWCKKIDREVFTTPEFAQEAGNQFIFVLVDFPMNKQLAPDVTQQNANLKQKFGITGYPTVVILDANGNYLSETGYQPGGGKAYADHLKSLINS